MRSPAPSPQPTGRLLQSIDVDLSHCSIASPIDSMLFEFNATTALSASAAAFARDLTLLANAADDVQFDCYTASL
jgi:hypothetical protein